MYARLFSCAAVLLALSGAACADVVAPTSYSTLNGETGSFTYWDDSYNGTGNTTQSLSPLSGGLGDLTDGIVATQNWNLTPGPYVGWSSVNPDITFSFTGTPTFTSVTVYFDDSNGAGGVAPPSAARVTIGANVFNFSITDPAGGEPLFATLPIPNVAGSSLQLELFDGAGPWVFVSEVSFNGLVPAPGAALLLGLGVLAAGKRRR